MLSWPYKLGKRPRENQRKLNLIEWIVQHTTKTKFQQQRFPRPSKMFLVSNSDSDVLVTDYLKTSFKTCMCRNSVERLR